MNQLVISLEALGKNYRSLKQRFSGAECGAVVKANGYGLGAVPIAKRLAAEGCKSFFVATLEEGIELREAIKEKIFILHGVQKNEVKEFRNYRLIPVLNNLAQLAVWPKEKPALAHFDTGMTRLGFFRADLDKVKEYNILAVMSHLALAERRNNSKNKQQLKNFREIAAKFPRAKKSLCNSYAIYLDTEYHCDLARPGIALYGGNPTPGQKNPMANVASLTAPILQINEINKPQTVGYGGEYLAQKGDVIATIPLGYADGILRSLAKHGKTYVKNHQLPIVGRISMDLITIKINNLPQAQRRIGQMVEILGENYNICDMATDAGTLEYEIITRLGQRFERIYKSLK